MFDFRSQEGNLAEKSNNISRPTERRCILRGRALESDAELLDTCDVVSCGMATADAAWWWFWQPKGIGSWLRLVAIAAYHYDVYT